MSFFSLLLPSSRADSGAADGDEARCSQGTLPGPGILLVHLPCTHHQGTPSSLHHRYTTVRLRHHAVRLRYLWEAWNYPGRVTLLPWEAWTTLGRVNPGKPGPPWAELTHPEKPGPLWAELTHPPREAWTTLGRGIPGYSSPEDGQRRGILVILLVQLRRPFCHIPLKDTSRKWSKGEQKW